MSRECSITNINLQDIATLVLSMHRADGGFSQGILLTLDLFFNGFGGVQPVLKEKRKINQKKDI